MEHGAAERRNEWIAAGIYDPRAPDAPDRLELLEWIASHDIGLDAIVDAWNTGRLTSVVGDRALRPGPRRSMTEIAAASGLSVDRVLDLHRASGMPAIDADMPFYTDDELSVFELFALAARLFSNEELVHFVRVMGTSLRRVAEAASEMFLRDVEAPLHEGPTPSPVELARANNTGVELARMAAAVFEPLFRVHLEVATQSNRRARVGLLDYRTLPLTVGFVDLREFTSHAGTLEPEELLELVMRFESASIELVGLHGGRLVKLIGDEVMFTAVEPSEAVAIGVRVARRGGQLGERCPCRARPRHGDRQWRRRVRRDGQPGGTDHGHRGSRGGARQRVGRRRAHRASFLRGGSPAVEGLRRAASAVVAGRLISRSARAGSRWSSPGRGRRG